MVINGTCQPPAVELRPAGPTVLNIYIYIKHTVSFLKEVAPRPSSGLVLRVCIVNGDRSVMIFPKIKIKIDQWLVTSKYYIQ